MKDRLGKSSQSRKTRIKQQNSEIMDAFDGAE